MTLFGSLFARGGALALLAAFVLASCTVVVEEPDRPGPVACTFEYAPVCARRGDDRQTFGNACLARAEGYRVTSQGECHRGGGGGGGGDICTREYAPVCGERGGQRQTFGNSCVARSEGFRVVYQGECRRGGGGGGGGGQQFCTREYAPVCARRGNQVRTFGNSCEAEAAEFRIIRAGEC